MSKTVLVTGATGFVGGHVLEALAQTEGMTPVAACRDAARLPAGFRGEVRQGDLRDPVYRKTLLKGIDTVCHAAAWTSLWGHAKQSRELYLEPSLALLAEAKQAGVSRFINVSTTSAAAPQHSADAMSCGIPRPFWPHLGNVIAIEDALRQASDGQFCGVNLRLGIFAGNRYALGLLPILVPRLKTHLVPWVAGGKTSLPLIDGRDIGAAFAAAAKADSLSGYVGFNIVGPEVPSVRQVIEFLHNEYGLPKPHFGVPFAIAYPFAWLMEKLDPLVPWEPLVTRSIIHLMEEVSADNARASRMLGYRPRYHWKDAVRAQMDEMQVRQTRPMKMYRPI